MSDFYLRAARILDFHSIQNSSLKSLVKSNSKDESDSKRLLKLTISTLEFLTVLRQLIQITGIQNLESKAFGERGNKSTENQFRGKGKSKDNGKGKGKAVEEEKDSKNKPATSTSSPSSTSLLLVLLHDLLFSPRNQISSSSSWPPKVALERHKARLKAELIKIQLKTGASRLVDLKSGGEERKISERIPRWIRINEPKILKEACLEMLAKSQWKEAGEDAKNGVVLKNRSFHSTPHLPNLLCFHPSQTSQLLASPLFQSGSIIMQDLASCFPAQALVGDAPLTAEDRFIDATSAPGNKTSHLSGLVEMRLNEIRENRSTGGEKNPSGSLEKGIARVTAFEHSPARFKTLSSLLSKFSCLCDESEKKFQLSNKWKGRGGNGFQGNPKVDSSKRKRDGNGAAAELNSRAVGSRNVEPVLSDFLTTDPFSVQWKDVSHMLLDPSCSGSGIVGRMDYLTEGSGNASSAAAGVGAENEEEVEEQEGDGRSKENQSPKKQRESRLLKLGEFQLKMIQHAMKFPSLRRFTYSTCSIHAEENEHVVLKALQSAEAKSQSFNPNSTSKAISKKFTPWRVAPRSKVIPTWSTRGIPEECGQDRILADSLVRSTPGGDTSKFDLEALSPGDAHKESCNGFFLALFVRDEIEGEEAGAEAETETDVEEENQGEDEEIEVEGEPNGKKRKLNKKKKDAKKKKRKALKELETEVKVK